LGLGLSTVYGIVKQSGGHIMVSSEPNQGTTIEVYLPRHVGEPAPAETSSVADPPTTATETILLVEDEESVRRVTARMLRGAGYEVIVAANAREAALVFENHARKIHLLVTDVVMPQVNGPQLAHQLVQQRPDLRVLYISGYPDGALGHHSTPGEGIAIIGKPFTAPDLLRKVRKTLDHD
jgi:CheY-like chemotaxis protein